jgi:hypothetical protein
MDASQIVPALVSSLTTAGAVFAYVVKIGTKVETNKELVDARFNDLKELITEKFNVVGVRFDSQDNRLGRIERSLNGHLKE